LLPANKKKHNTLRPIVVSFHHKNNNRYRSRAMRGWFLACLVRSKITDQTVFKNI